MIDEAIAKYKEITNTDANCPAHCNISCDKCVQESEQLAEWLEELKALRNGLNIKCDNLNEALEKGKKIGYNKAIDDVESEFLKCDKVHYNLQDILCVINKLKVGVENEQSI